MTVSTRRRCRGRGDLDDQKRGRLNVKVAGALPRRINDSNVRDVHVPAAPGHLPGQAVDPHTPRRHSELAIELAREDRYSRLMLVRGWRHDETPPRVELQVSDPKLRSEPVEVLDRVAERQWVRHQMRLRPALHPGASATVLSTKEPSHRGIPFRDARAARPPVWIGADGGCRKGIDIEEYECGQATPKQAGQPEQKKIGERCS